MRQGPRMSCDERKGQILEAVRKVFSRKGLEGATSKELAKEAGISEALLYQHFKSKEDLHRAMLSTCKNSWLRSGGDKIMALEPSSSVLVTLVYFLVSRKLSSHSPEMDSLFRLLLRSMAGDGEFARIGIKEAAHSIVSKLEECIKAAIKAGDIEGKGGVPKTQAWLSERLAVTVMLDFLSPTPLVD